MSRAHVVWSAFGVDVWVLPKLFIYIYIYEYTLAVFRHSRRGHHIPLQIMELTSGPLEEQSVLLTAELSLQPSVFFIFTFYT